MALYELGLSQRELRERYERAVAEDMPETELAARFGRPQLSGRGGAPPYRFLVEEFSFEGMPDYNQLCKPVWLDNKGREYTPQGDNPRLLYVRIPKGAPQELDFPGRSELLLLRRADKRASDESMVMRAHYMLAQRTATGLLQLEQALPTPEQTEEAEQQRREASLVSRYKRRYAILEGETTLSSQSMERLSARPVRPDPPPRAPLTLPRVPIVKRLKLSKLK
jgi:hypothetical protein